MSCQGTCNNKPPSYDFSWLTKNTTLIEGIDQDLTNQLISLIEMLWKKVITPELGKLTFPSPIESARGETACLNNIPVRFTQAFPFGNLKIDNINSFLCQSDLKIGQFQVWPDTPTQGLRLWSVLVMNSTINIPLHIDGLFTINTVLQIKIQVSARLIFDLICSSDTIVFNGVELISPALIRSDFTLPSELQTITSFVNFFSGNFLSKQLEAKLIEILPTLMGAVNFQLKNAGIYPFDTKIPCDLLAILVPYCGDNNRCVFQYGGLSKTNPPGNIPCGTDKCISSCMNLPGACCIACTAALNKNGKNSQCVYQASLGDCIGMSNTASQNPHGNKNNTALYINVPTNSKVGIMDWGHSECDYIGSTSCGVCQKANTSGDKNSTVSSYCVLDPTWVPEKLDKTTVGPAIPGAQWASFIQKRP